MRLFKLPDRLFDAGCIRVPDDQCPELCLGSSLASIRPSQSCTCLVRTRSGFRHGALQIGQGTCLGEALCRETGEDKGKGNKNWQAHQITGSEYSAVQVSVSGQYSHQRRLAQPIGTSRQSGWYFNGWQTAFSSGNLFIICTPMLWHFKTCNRSNLSASNWLAKDICEVLVSSKGRDWKTVLQKVRIPFGISLLLPLSVTMLVLYPAGPALSQQSMSSTAEPAPPAETGMDAFLGDLSRSMGLEDQRGGGPAADLDTPAASAGPGSGFDLETDGSSVHDMNMSSAGSTMSMETQPDAADLAKELSISITRDKYTMFVSFDLPEGDLFNARDLDADQCIDLCNKDKDCSAVTYDRWNRFCFAKSFSRSRGQLYVQAKSDTYVLEQEARNIPSSSSSIEIKRRRGKGFSGQPDYTLSNASYEECRRVCSQDAKCVAFNQIQSSRTCEFFFQPPEYFSKNGYQIGVKQQIR
ncbi:PAN domain-containing protein [Roseibium sp. M-1]